MKVKSKLVEDQWSGKGVYFVANKCNSLRFGGHGKSWDRSIDILDMEGNLITYGWYDSTWGHWVYFICKDQWYKFDVRKEKEVVE